MPDKKIQEKYVLYQLLAQNLEALKQQLQIIEQQFVETRTTMESVENIEKTNEKNDIFLSIGSGCYGKGKITDRKDILVNVGAGILINKKIADAKSFLRERISTLERMAREIQGEMELVAKQMNELGIEIQELAQKEKS